MCKGTCHTSAATAKDQATVHVVVAGAGGEVGVRTLSLRWRRWRRDHMRRGRWRGHRLNHRRGSRYGWWNVWWRYKGRRWRLHFGHLGRRLYFLGWRGWGRRRWRRDDHLLDEHRFEGFFQKRQALARQAGDQHIAHHQMHDQHQGNTFEPAAIVLLPETVRPGAAGARARGRQFTQSAHWTNCSAPITAILVSPCRLLPESTLANTA